MLYWFYQGLQATTVGLVICIFVWGDTLTGLLALMFGFLNYWQLGSVARNVKENRLRTRLASILAGLPSSRVTKEEAKLVLALFETEESLLQEKREKKEDQDELG